MAAQFYWVSLPALWRVNLVVMGKVLAKINHSQDNQNNLYLFS